jgi:hypothetical protein
MFNLFSGVPNDFTRGVHKPVDSIEGEFNWSIKDRVEGIQFNVRGVTYAQPGALSDRSKASSWRLYRWPSQVNPSLLRPDADQQLARQLAAVRTFKAAQLLLNFLPGVFTLGTG